MVDSLLSAGQCMAPRCTMKLPTLLQLSISLPHNCVNYSADCVAQHANFVTDSSSLACMRQPIICLQWLPLGLTHAEVAHRWQARSLSLSW